MYQYDQNGNRVPVPQNQAPQGRARMNMDMSKKVKGIPVWGWIVIAVVLLLAIGGAIYMATQSKSSGTRAAFGGGKKRSFGFRFY